MVKITRDIQYDTIIYYVDNNLISVRTNEPDNYKKCFWQTMQLDDEATKILSDLKSWIDRNLK